MRESTRLSRELEIVPVVNQSGTKKLEQEKLREVINNEV